MVEKYEVNKILNIVFKIGDVLGGVDVIEYIAITPNEFSVYINNGVSMVLIAELNNLKDIFDPDTVFFNENNPQLVVSNIDIQLDNIQDEEIKYVMNFVNESAKYICPCTGSEIRIFKNEIKIFVDQNTLIHNEYIGVYELFDESNLAFKIVFDIQRPYLSIMDWESVKNE